MSPPNKVLKREESNCPFVIQDLVALFQNALIHHENIMRITHLVKKSGRQGVGGCVLHHLAAGFGGGGHHVAYHCATVGAGGLVEAVNSWTECSCCSCCWGCTYCCCSSHPQRDLLGLTLVL